MLLLCCGKKNEDVRTNILEDTYVLIEQFRRYEWRLINEDFSLLKLVLIAQLINSGEPYGLYLDLAYPMMYLCSADKN